MVRCNVTTHVTTFHDKLSCTRRYVQIRFGWWSVMLSCTSCSTGCCFLDSCSLWASRYGPKKCISRRRTNLWTLRLVDWTEGIAGYVATSPLDSYSQLLGFHSCSSTCNEEIQKTPMLESVIVKSISRCNPWTSRPIRGPFPWVHCITVHMQISYQWMKRPTNS